LLGQQGTSTAAGITPRGTRKQHEATERLPVARLATAGSLSAGSDRTSSSRSAGSTALRRKQRGADTCNFGKQGSTRCTSHTCIARKRERLAIALVAGSLPARTIAMPRVGLRTHARCDDRFDSVRVERGRRRWCDLGVEVSVGWAAGQEGRIADAEGDDAVRPQRAAAGSRSLAILARAPQVSGGRVALLPGWLVRIGRERRG
jgi:hypothetical protein